MPPNLGPEPAILLVSASDDVTQDRVMQTCHSVSNEISGLA